MSPHMLPNERAVNMSDFKKRCPFKFTKQSLV